MCLYSCLWEERKKECSKGKKSRFVSPPVDQNQPNARWSSCSLFFSRCRLEQEASFKRENSSTPIQVWSRLHFNRLRPWLQHPHWANDTSTVYTQKQLAGIRASHVQTGQLHCLLTSSLHYLFLEENSNRFMDEFAYNPSENYTRSSNRIAGKNYKNL